MQVVKRGKGNQVRVRHDSDILFTFVMEGHLVLEAEGRDPHELQTGDAFVISPGMTTRHADPSGDVELLEVSLSGWFRTEQV